MKLSFYSVALLGAIAMTQVNAVNLNMFAEIDSNTVGEGLTDVDADVDAAADVSADACEQNVGGVTIRLSTPECVKGEEAKPEVSFEQ